MSVCRLADLFSCNPAVAVQLFLAAREGFAGVLLKRIHSTPIYNEEACGEKPLVLRTHVIPLASSAISIMHDCPAREDSAKTPDASN